MYRQWSQNCFGGMDEENVSFDHWLDNNPNYVRPDDVRNISMDQMRERLRVESLDPSFDWKPAEVAKDLAAHYWFLREWWV